MIVHVPETPREQDYAHMEDRRLTWTAKGLLLYLRVCHRGQDVRFADLIPASERDTPEALRAALQELQDCGYLTVEEGNADGTGQG